MASPATAPTGTQARPRLLCVDDEPNVLEGIRDRLHRSFDVRIAAGGIEGLKLLNAEPDSFAFFSRQYLHQGAMTSGGLRSSMLSCMG